MRIRFFALTLAFAAAAASHAQSAFWGELRAGKFGVGYRSLYEADVARAYDSDYTIPGAAAIKKPRPIFLALWYPAAPDQSSAMVYRDYFRAPSGDSSATEFAPRLRKFTRDTAAEFTLGKKFDAFTDEDRAAWDGLLATPIFAALNARPATGRFPVVIYHPGLGGTFQENSVACEYLASHGYVVLTSAFQAADSSTLKITNDLATSLDDLNFVLRYAATLPFAAIGKVAAIGHDFGAQAALAWRAQPNSSVDAVVALDNNAAYLGLDQSPALQTALAANATSTVPVLQFADARRHPRLEMFRAFFKFAPLYESALDGPPHNTFISQGVLNREDQSHRTYEAICRLTLQFLEAHLRDDSKARQALESSAEVHFQPPLLAAPTSAQVVKLYISDRPASTAALTNLVKTSADSDLLLNAAMQLFEDGRTREAAGLLTWSARALPKSARVQCALGQGLAAMGDKTGARTAFEKALQLVSEDPTLDASVRLAVTKSAEAGLAALRK
jgi:pimeloyl-ACP methyl ester carboxylesterase